LIAFERAVAGETVLLAHRFHEFLIPLPQRSGPYIGTPMQQTARLVPMRNASGITGAIAFIQDVSERVIREEELRSARDAAEHASKAKSDFLAAMSHELRTPLNAVIGYSELLTQGVGGNTLLPQQKQHVHRITSSAWHLISIIDQVLTFSRAEAGHEEISISSVNLCDEARRALQQIEPQAIAKGIDVQLHLAEDPFIVQTDALRIQQILINLLGNAVKFTETGRIDVTVGRDEDAFAITVQDTGPGIPADHHEHVFEAFTQVDQSATRAKGGTGLGLPVSRKLAELLGGTLELVSSSPQGSTFRLRVPLIR
jgi:signal transduction histidine kinase